jgi:hypothetical protein
MAFWLMKCASVVYRTQLMASQQQSCDVDRDDEMQTNYTSKYPRLSRSDSRGSIFSECAPHSLNPLDRTE